MDDVISRQDAITLPVMPKKYRKYQTYNLDDAYEQGWFDLQKCIEKLPYVQTEPQWIPCSERLPNREEYMKNNGLFNVSDGNRSYSEWFDIRDKQRFGEPTMSGFRVDYAVIAWMPLPEPYKGGEQDG